MKVVFRSALILLLLLLVGISAEVIRVSLMQWPPVRLDPVRTTQHTPKPCSREMLLDTSAITSRMIEIDVGAKAARVELSMTLPRAHECVRAVMMERTGEDVLLLPQSFGQLRLGGGLRSRDFVLDSPKFGPGDERVRLTVRGTVPYESFLLISLVRDELSRTLRSPGSDSLVIRLEDTRVASLHPVPAAMSDSLLIYASTTGDPLSHISLAVEKAEGSAGGNDGPDLRGTFSALNRLIDIPVLSTFLNLIVTVVPLIVLLIATRAAQPHDEALIELRERSRGLALLGLIAAGAATYAFNFYSDWYLVLSRHVEDLLRAYGVSVTTTPVLGTGLSYIVPVSLGLLAPAALSQSRKNRTSRWVASLGRVVVFLLIAAASTALAAAGPVSGLPPYMVLFLAIGLLLLWIACEALFRIIGGRRMGVSLLVVVLMGVPLIARFDWSSGELVNAWVWLAITIAVGMAVIRTVSAVLRRGSRWRAEDLGVRLPADVLERWKQAGTWARRAVFALLLLLLAVPIGGMVRPGYVFSAIYHANTPSSVAQTALYVLPIIWLLAVLRYLHQHGTEISVPRAARAVAVAGMAVLLFPVRAEWFNVPVTFMIGYLAFRWAVRGEDEKGLEISTSAQLMTVRGQQLAKLLDLRLGESAYRSFRRNRMAALRKGEVELEAYQAEVSKWKTALDDLQHEAEGGAPAAERDAFGLGPEGSAWANAIHGVRYSALFAIPWIALGVADLLASPANWLYPQWTILGELAYMVGKWLCFGFALGYLFPYLPGRSGLDKGLFLFAVTTLPLLPAAVLAPPTLATWQPLLIWSVQVFVHLVLLGLYAFDHTVLRRSGERDWRLILEIHGWSAVGVSISTIALAIATAVTTLLSGEAAALLQSALRLAVPFLTPEGGITPP
jgi:hypothetical protein